MFDDYSSGSRPIIVTGFDPKTSKLELDRLFSKCGLGCTKKIIFIHSAGSEILRLVVNDKISAS